MTDTEKDWVTPIGAPALEAIKEMVAALECDYDRLEELREERIAWTSDIEEDQPIRLAADWAQEFPDEAEELKDLEEAAGECESREQAEERIQEDPLSLQFRSGWGSINELGEAAEYELLLSTGGPAVRIIGEVSNGEAHSAQLEVQDWFKPWTEFITTGDDYEALLTYARCFYMDE